MDSNSFALNLSLFISKPSNDSSKHLQCAELLKILLTDDLDLSTWLNLPVSTQSAIKTTLLECLMHEQSIYILSDLGKTVMKLARSLISGNDNNSWPELLPCLYQCVTSSTSHNYAKMEAYLIFADLTEKLGETLFSSLKDSYHSVLRSTLYNNTVNMNVRAMAMCAAIEYIICVSSSKEKERFQDLLTGMMMTLTDAVSCTEEELFYRVEFPLARLVKLAEREPRFFRMQLVDVVSTVLDIVEAECVVDEVRYAGVEFLLALVEAKERAPGMMRKLPFFIGRCFALLLKLLVLGIEDGPAWYNAEALRGREGTTTIFSVGCNGLMRYSLALGCKSVAYEAKEQLSAYLDAPEWEKRHAALFALGYVARGCPEVVTKHLDELMIMVLKCFQDPHPRVRWAACLAICGFFRFFEESHVLEEYHNQVYLVLSVVLDDDHPRVQAYAMLALIEICGSNKPEALIPHLDGIVNKLLVLLQNEKQMLQLQALGSLASAALSVKEYFRTYYDIVVPHLKGVLRNADLKSDLPLRADAIECISNIAEAVGKEKFTEDAKQIIEVIVPLQALQERADDHYTWQILWAYVRICKCMGKEFLPYLTAVIPYLIVCAEWHDESHRVDDNSIEEVMLRDKTLWDIRKMGKLGHVCKLLAWCVEILKEDFYPWIPEVVSFLFPLLKFHSDNHVRKQAVEAMPSMLRCVKLAAEKGIVQGGSESYFTELSGSIIMALVKALHKEKVVDLCAIMLDQLNDCLQICGPLLHEGLIPIIMNGIIHVINDSLSRKQELTERAKLEDFDYEEAEMLLKDERWLEVKIFFYICQILRELINAFRAAFLPFLDELSSYLLPMLVVEKTISSERFHAISIFTDLMVKCPESAGKYYEVYFPLILGLSDDEDPDVRKSALYGLRFWAKFGYSSFKDFVGVAFSRINKVIMHSKALEPKNEIAYNYAVSALGRICLFHGESIDLAQVIPIWLNCLPIKAVLLEAKLVHEMLCLMIERSPTEVFGPNNEYIPKIVSVFTEVLCSKNDLAWEETANYMINVLRHLQQTIPISTLLSEPYLLPQHEMELQSILSLDEGDN